MTAKGRERNPMFARYDAGRRAIALPTFINSRHNETMSKSRKQQFLVAVAEAAHARPKVQTSRDGCAENLTEAGRAAGIASMHSAPRCQSKRRDGAQCRAPALRGASKCVKHGGRVQVPSHPANIRRYLNGELDHYLLDASSGSPESSAWDAMTVSERRELAALLPKQILRTRPRTEMAAEEWVQVRGHGFRAVRDFRRRFAGV